MNKSDIRRVVKAAKSTISAQQRLKFALSIANLIEDTKEFKEAKNILLYHSLPDEVDTHCMIARWQGAKQLYLPTTLTDGNLQIREFNEECQMECGAYGIYESLGEVVDKSVIDLIIVPAVAFDRDRNRLGRGKGYYDRLLTGCKAYKIGIAYTLQIVESIPAEKHDIKMDLIITEKGDL